MYRNPCLWTEELRPWFRSVDVSPETNPIGLRETVRLNNPQSHKELWNNQKAGNITVKLYVVVMAMIKMQIFFLKKLEPNKRR